jgi:hypothetical protein
MAEFKLTMKHPEYPDDKEFELDGYGVITNGETVTITQEMQDAWSAQNEGIEYKKALAQNGVVQFDGKDKLMDTPLTLEDLQDPEVAEAQASKATKAKAEGGDSK